LFEAPAAGATAAAASVESSDALINADMVNGLPKGSPPDAQVLIYKRLNDKGMSLLAF
jgi:hypothetical protein